MKRDKFITYCKNYIAPKKIVDEYFQEETDGTIRVDEEMNEIKLNRCPICGKMPKVKRDYAYEASWFGAWCTIQCKPLFRKPHLKIESGKSTWERAYKYAVIHWNESAEEVVETND